MTPAVAAANGQQTSARSNTGTSKPAKATSLTLAQKLALKLKAARKHRSAIRFLKTHRSLALSSGKRAAPSHGRSTGSQRPRRRSATTGGSSVLAQSYTRLAASRTQPPRSRSARCSGVLRSGTRSRVVRVGSPTTARNGQYLGLFQMGTYARQVSGHGDSAYEQARAAYRFFVVSRPRLEPVELSLGRVLTDTIFVAKCGAGSRARVPFHASQ